MEGMPISSLCDELGLQPTVFYRWQKEFFENGAARIISDNGPQFIAKDFKEFIRISGMTHVRTSPYYPAIERQNRTLAQITQRGVHPPWHAVVAGRCTASG